MVGPKRRLLSCSVPFKGQRFSAQEQEPNNCSRYCAPASALGTFRRTKSSPEALIQRLLDKHSYAWKEDKCQTLLDGPAVCPACDLPQLRFNVVRIRGLGTIPEVQYISKGIQARYPPIVLLLLLLLLLSLLLLLLLLLL